MWQCRSPADVALLDQRGQRRAGVPGQARGLAAHPGSPAARARCSRGRGAHRPPARSRTSALTAVRVVEDAVLRDVQAAAPPPPSRSAALCTPEPVKCWSRLPSWSRLGDPQVHGDAAEWVRALAPALARRTRRSRSRSSSPSAVRERRADRSLAATTSRSLTLSACRRAEPASSTRVRRRDGAQRLRRSRSPISTARGQQRGAAAARRPACRPAPASDASTLASNFGPSPLTVAQAVRGAPPRAAPRASRSRARRTAGAPAWGPSPGSRVIATSPGGNLARSRSTRDGDRRRSAASVRIFSCSVVPIPGSSVARPCTRQRRDRHRCLADRLGGRPVGEDAVDDRAVQLVEIAELGQRFGYRAIGDIGARSPPLE